MQVRSVVQQVIKMDPVQEIKTIQIEGINRKICIGKRYVALWSCPLQSVNCFPLICAEKSLIVVSVICFFGRYGFTIF